MSISKQQIIKQFTPLLEDLGFYYLKDSEPFYSGMFYKKIENNNNVYIFQIAFIKSRFNSEIFTVEFEINKIFNFGFNLEFYKPEFLSSSGGRLSNFIFFDERINLALTHEYFTEPKILDIWWQKLTNETVNGCIKAIKLAEKRFLEQPELFCLIENSEPLKEELLMIERVIKKTSNITQEEKDSLKYQPKKYRDGVTKDWFEAAEIIIKQHKPNMNIKAYTDTLAVTAWRQCNLL